MWGRRGGRRLECVGSARRPDPGVLRVGQQGCRYGHTFVVVSAACWQAALAVGRVTLTARYTCRHHDRLAGCDASQQGGQQKAEGRGVRAEAEQKGWGAAGASRQQVECPPRPHTFATSGTTSTLPVPVTESLPACWAGWQGDGASSAHGRSSAHSGSWPRLAARVRPPWRLREETSAPAESPTTVAACELRHSSLSSANTCLGVLLSALATAHGHQRREQEEGEWPAHSIVPRLSAGRTACLLGWARLGVWANADCYELI